MNHNVVIKITLKGAFKTGFKIGVAAAGFKTGYEIVRAIDYVTSKALCESLEKLFEKSHQDKAKVYEYHTAEE